MLFKDIFRDEHATEEVVFGDGCIDKAMFGGKF